MDFSTLVANQRAFFRGGATLPASARIDALKALHDRVRAWEPRIAEALRADLGKSAAESYMTETGLVLSELSDMARRVKKWMRPERAPTPLSLWPASSRIHYEPLGAALVFSPWNYPFQLSLLPLAAAVAAGNCVVLKPSVTAPATAALLEELIAAVFPPEHVAFAPGGVPAATALLNERFDIILYTGSARVGHIVMEAAAKHLTPVCLELGGKSPAIVTRDARLDLAARRIAWGKLLNAGQTCVAPDHVLADARVRDELITRIEREFTRMLGPDPLKNPDYARIVSEKAFDRLCGLGQPLLANRDALKIAPRVFKAEPDDPTMREEIFGPLLPVLEFNDIEEALESLRAKEKPLALYLFSENERTIETVLAGAAFGGGCVNDVMLHAASPRLPFGGVGASGMGRYHGKAGFLLFSNPKSIVRGSTRIDVPLRYPPFGKRALAIMKRLLR